MRLCLRVDSSILTSAGRKGSENMDSDAAAARQEAVRMSRPFSNIWRDWEKEGEDAC